MTRHSRTLPILLGAILLATSLAAADDKPQKITLEKINGHTWLVAETTDTLLADEAVTVCWLAASAPIHKQLLDTLNPKARGKITQVPASNLAGNDPKELLGNFAKADS